MPLIVGTLHSPACLKALKKDFEELSSVSKKANYELRTTNYELNIRPASRIFPADLLEARLDSLPAALLPKVWPLPVIATARHPAEGGQGNLTITKRRRLLEEALSWAAAIDVELRSAKQLASTIARAHQAGVLVICSFHDFKTVPSLVRLEESVLRAEDLGADLFKIAGTVHGMDELLRLVTFQSGTHSSLPIASMGMGWGGKFSRVLLAAYGSALSYGWLYKPQVLGQWSASELSFILQKLSF